MSEHTNSPTGATAPTPPPTDPSGMSLMLKSVLRNDAVVRELAVDLATGLREPTDVLTSAGLDAEDFKILSSTTVFRRYYEEAQAVWQADSSVKDRIRAKAAMVVEEGLMMLHGAIQEPDIALSHRLEALKQASTLADAVPRRDGAGPDSGPRFSLTITVPPAAGSPGVTIDQTATIPVASTDPDEALA